MKKILIIEDDQNVLANTRDLLEAEGYAVTTGANGRLGIEMALKIKPDLIICDVMMPEMDGHNVLKTLKKQPATLAIPFIFLTARAEKSDVRQGMNLGADDYLIKPYTRSDLLDAIESRLVKQIEYNALFATQLEEADARLKNILYFDAITGLPTRLNFREQFLQTILSRPPPTETWTLAVIYLSLDRFSLINDTFGPACANLLLKDVTARLKEILGNTVTISRLQVDEFAIILCGNQTDLMIRQTCQDILDKLAGPFNLEQIEGYTTASLGIDYYGENATEPEILLNNARIAMLLSKKYGGNTYQFYSFELNAPRIEELKLENDLRHALGRNELEVYYQPQVNIRKGHMVGAEALLRWKHPTMGFISPVVFIPIAEETGLIHSIGAWVLKTACLQTKSWQDRGFPPFCISINVSSYQLFRTNFTASIEQIIKETGLDPKYVELELTESALIKEIDRGRATLAELKALGIHIAIDDFGTGFSSLSYLKQFPFNTLKIDRYFVQNVGQDAENSAITQATIQMAHQLNLKVTAEGVETENELEFLTANDCDEIQGYLFSRPLTAASFEELLTLNPPLTLK